MRNRKTTQDSEAFREEIRRGIREKRERARRIRQRENRRQEARFPRERSDGIYLPQAKGKKNRKSQKSRQIQGIKENLTIHKIPKNKEILKTHKIQKSQENHKIRKIQKDEKLPNPQRPALFWVLRSKIFPIRNLLFSLLLCLIVAVGFLVWKHLEEGGFRTARVEGNLSDTIETGTEAQEASEGNLSEHMEKDDYILFSASVSESMTETVTGAGSVSYTWDMPQFAFPMDPDGVSERIAEFFRKRKADFAGTAKAYADTMDAGAKASLERRYAILYAKEHGKILSVLQKDTITDSQGVHEVYQGLNFDQSNGNLLEFADAFDDVDTALEAGKQHIVTTLEEESYQDVRKGDYKRSGGDVLTDSAWYLAEDGMHILCNPGIATRESAGVVDLLFPQGTALLKPQYR